MFDQLSAEKVPSLINNPTTTTTPTPTPTTNSTNNTNNTTTTNNNKAKCIPGGTLRVLAGKNRVAWLERE
jgi:hypothetical protein